MITPRGLPHNPIISLAIAAAFQDPPFLGQVCCKNELEIEILSFLQN